MLRFKQIRTCRFASSFMGPSTSRAQDHYTTLGINRTATIKEVKAAFYELSNKYHPDRNPQDKENASLKFQAIVNAYEVLGNAEKRKQYDSQFTNPYIRDPSTIRQNVRSYEQPTYTDSNSKDMQVSRSRDLYRANALSNRLARWDKSAKDRVEESILEHPDVQTSIQAGKQVILYFFCAIMIAGVLMSSQQLDYHEDKVADKDSPKGRVFGGIF